MIMIVLPVKLIGSGGTIHFWLLVQIKPSYSLHVYSKSHTVQVSYNELAICFEQLLLLELVVHELLN